MAGIVGVQDQRGLGAPWEKAERRLLRLL